MLLRRKVICTNNHVIVVLTICCKLDLTTLMKTVKSMQAFWSDWLALKEKKQKNFFELLVFLSASRRPTQKLNQVWLKMGKQCNLEMLCCTRQLSMTIVWLIGLILCHNVGVLLKSIHF